MAGRERNIQLFVRVTEEEEKMIRYKMSQIGTTNFSAYARKMLIDGYVIVPDYSALKELAQVLGRLSGSINQIARRVNETRHIYRQEVDEIRRLYAQVKKECTVRLLSIAEKGY